MKYGDRVEISDAVDNRIVRAVVEVDGEIVFVTRPEELEQSISEHREPTCIGFRLSDIIRIVSTAMADGSDEQHARVEHHCGDCARPAQPPVEREEQP